MVPKRPYSVKKNKLGFNRYGLIFIALAFVAMALIFMNSKGVTEDSHTSSLQMGSTTTIRKQGILSATVEYSVYGDVRRVPYYYCNASRGNRHLVLLHGAKFTKEDWKESGILKTLCDNSQLSVKAVDLPVQAGHRDLMAMLTSLSKSSNTKLPVALVTPSASGMTITDWMATGRISDLPRFVEKWIPVAAGSVMAATEDQLARMAHLDDFGVFAIFGSKDRMGRETTGRLETFVGAKILEMEGRHACYLDSPMDFCSAVFEELGLQ